jgi:hypothetical protein
MSISTLSDQSIPTSPQTFSFEVPTPSGLPNKYSEHLRIIVFQMAVPVSQKTIPTLYKLSSSQAHCIHWALEEVASSHGIKYNVKNFSRRANPPTQT